MQLLSFLISGLSALGLLFIPAMRGGELAGREHSLMSLLLILICLGFVYGVGFRFKKRWANIFISPLFVWPSMLAILYAWIFVVSQ